jgi:protein subunit release factor A
LHELQKAYVESCQETNRDMELEEMLIKERDEAQERLLEQERAVIQALVPPDPTDSANAILEIRPGS